MEIEEISAAEVCRNFLEDEERFWKGHQISFESSFEKKRAKELCRLRCQRPSKRLDPQSYFTYRAREEQIKYELDFRQCGVELIRGNGFEFLVLYGHALNHLKRRGEYEQKVYAVWLQRIQAKENPPTPDIIFISQGISLNQLV